MKRLIKGIIREFRKPIILQDTSGITQVEDLTNRYEIIKRDIEHVSDKLNRNIVIIPADFKMYE